MWETTLSQDAVLYLDAGEQSLQVWSDKTPEIRDQSRNRRRDFFLGKIIDLPANLAIGRYVLKVTIVDKQANRIAEGSLPVQVVAGDIHNEPRP